MTFHICSCLVVGVLHHGSLVKLVHAVAPVHGDPKKFGPSLPAGRLLELNATGTSLGLTLADQVWGPSIGASAYQQANRHVGLEEVVVSARAELQKVHPPVSASLMRRETASQREVLGAGGNGSDAKASSDGTHTHQQAGQA